MSLVRLATVLLLLVLGATPALAQGRRVTEGTLLWRSAQQETAVPAPLLATDVQMRVTGMVVRAIVHQQFTNPSPEWAEGIYVFPLPEEAAVDHLRMQIGDRVVEGVIQERAAATAAYVPGPPAGRPGQPRRAGAAQRLHDLRRQHPARGGDRHRDRVPAGGALRRRAVRPALPDGRGPALHPGHCRRRARRHRLGGRHRRGAGRLAHHAPGAGPCPRGDQPRHAPGRAGSRGPAGRCGLAVPRHPHAAAERRPLRDRARGRQRRRRSRLPARVGSR